MEKTTVVMLLPCVEFFPPINKLSISVRGIVIMHRKLPSLAEECQRFTFPSLVLVFALFHIVTSPWKSSDWELPRALLILARTPRPSLDDSACKITLRRHPKLPERYAVLLPTAITLVETT